MKQYKLLKDLPTIEAGRIFEETKGSLGGTLLYATGFCSGFTIDKDGIKNFDDWFEEIKEPEQIYYVDSLGGYVSKLEKHQLTSFPALIANLKSTGNYFKTKEEAEAYLKYLKARAIIKQDTKGFKPNWNDTEQIKYSCSYQKDRFTGYGCVKPVVDSTKTTMSSLMYFKSKEDIEESLKKHPKEWKTYLFYEQ